jgi:hypothetical protein
MEQMSDRLKNQTGKRLAAHQNKENSKQINKH